MTQKERLIELIQDSVNGCARNWAETIAEYLLEHGVIVRRCRSGRRCLRIAKRKQKQILAREVQKND